MNTVDKFYWVMDHPAIGNSLGQAEIEITPHMVNPETGVIDDNQSNNTKMELWVEVSKSNTQGLSTHYWELDTGGDTFDEAVDELYSLTLKHYGDYKEDGELFLLWNEDAGGFINLDCMPCEVVVPSYLTASVFTTCFAAEQAVFKHKLKNVTVKHLSDL